MDQKSKTTAADFFIYLGIIIGLYVSTFNLISLSFDLINNWLPDVNIYNSYSIGYSVESMRVSLAALIIFFPAYIYLSTLSTKEVAITPEKKDLWVRRWFFFLTLFLTGLIIAIDLSFLVYMFIGGQDLTMRFVFKILVVLVTALSIFRFYLYELRRDVTLPTPKRKYLAYVVCLVVLSIVVIGIVVIGSPTKQRNMRFDEQRVSDLQNIQGAVTDYYRANNALPKDLDIMSQGTTYYLSNVKDPETAIVYEYQVISVNQYKLCANFSLDSTVQKGGSYTYPMAENFTHGVGRTCFDRTAGEVPAKPGSVPVIAQ